MCICQARHRLVFVGKFRKVRKHLSRFFEYHSRCLAQDYNVGIIADIAARSTEVDYRLRLWTLHTVSIDMAHNVMPHLTLTCLGNVVVDIILVSLKLGYLLIRNIEPQLLLGARKRYPQPSPCAELEVIREDRLHLGACITCRKR